jgi:selenocysteine-specific elongation factor
MTERHYILATAGHVDHGKSALVKALTGIDPDRLPEEKARGITIDLGFAHLELSTLNSSNPQLLHLGLVDVPGHEDFVKNMVAGVGSIDLALFVVAADDGWMPQTEEHLQILTYLGVTRAVVALTKIDLATDEPAVIAAVREQLRQSPFASASVIPTSVVSGRGIEELKSALVTVLEPAPSPRDIGKPRLAVDRAFALRGVGTVVTGTLTGGTLRRGQAVVIQPGGTSARIRSLQSHNRELETCGPGRRVALNLADVVVAERESTAADPEGVRRGQVITLPGLGGPTDTLDARLDRSARLQPACPERSAHHAAAPHAEQPVRPLRDGTRVRVHHGTENTGARVLFLNHAPLVPGQTAIAQLRLDRPLFVCDGDRFIVRDWQEQTTLAGGIVLEAQASRRRFRSEAARRFLSRRAEAPHELTVAVESLLDRDGAMRRRALLVQSHFSSEEIAGALDRLVTDGRAVSAGEYVARATWWTELRRRAVEAIDAEHAAHPERAGLALSQLRSAAPSDVPEVFDALVGELCRGGFVRAGEAIRRSGHRPGLPPPLAAAGMRLRSALAAKPFDPPSRKELAPDAASQQALRFLRDTGEVVEVNADLVLPAESLVRMRDAIVKFIQARGPATVSELRQTLDTSRRVLVPLLERFDRDGVTARQGDRRVLGKKAQPSSS